MSSAIFVEIAEKTKESNKQVKTDKMTEAKFRKQIAGTQFEQDMSNMFSMNGKPMARGIWNLLLSKRDCSLFAKGIKPHRMWRLKDVKWYFGITGGAQKCADQLQEYHDLLIKMNKAENE